MWGIVFFLVFICSLPADTALELSLEDVLCVLQLEGSEGVRDVPHLNCWCPPAAEEEGRVERGRVLR